MKINFKNGNIKSSLFVVFLYLSGILLLPLCFSYFFNNLLAEKAVSISIFLALLTLVFILFYSKNRKINNINNDNKMNLGISILIGVGGYLTMIILQILLGLIMLILSKIYGFEYISQNTQNINQIIRQYPIFILYVGILAPVLEELVFRKAVFGYFFDIIISKNKVLRFVISGLLSGLLFAIPHDGFSPMLIIYVIMGLLFSGLYLYTKRIITPIIAHILMNFTVVVAQVFLV